MSEQEPGITPLTELLEQPNLRTGRPYNPSNWPSFRIQEIRDDLRYRGIFSEDSVPTLLPEHSNANPGKIRAVLRNIRQLGLGTQSALRGKTLEEISRFWDSKDRGRNSLTRSVALSLWLETQQKPKNPNC